MGGGGWRETDRHYIGEGKETGRHYMGEGGRGRRRDAVREKDDRGREKVGWKERESDMGGGGREKEGWRERETDTHYTGKAEREEEGEM